MKSRETATLMFESLGIGTYEMLARRPMNKDSCEVLNSSSSYSVCSRRQDRAGGSREDI